ncbi:ABC transporter ATP-binding protein [Thermodesulfobacteriota bacterium B35]
MSTLLEIDKLSLAFQTDSETGGESHVLHQVCLRVAKGTTHALVGESGSGKSVTALSILRLLEETSRVRTSGRILFNGRDILGLGRKELLDLRGNRISMIFQEPMTSLNPVYTVGSQLVEPLVLHRNMTGDQARERALQLMERTGIDQPEYRFNAYPHQLSGGQRQRVMIAMALACRPDLLIADEPTTALDVTIQNQILDLIRDIQEEYNMAVLLITHDLPMVRRIAGSVSIMHNGRIVEQGTTDSIFSAPRDPYTIHLLRSVPHGTRSPKPGGRELVALQDVQCEFTLKTEWTGLLRRKKKTLKAVDGVDLTIRQGTTLGVVGESGSGKSTLAMCLLRLVPCRGRILYQRSDNGERIDLTTLSTARMRPLRRELQVVFQDPFSSLSPRLSVEQIIAEGLKVHKVCSSRQEERDLVARALEDVELDPDMASRFPHEFSGGQRQRIAIARSIVLRPDLLILDEPTSALDMTIQAQVIELLKKLQDRYGMTYMFITHDLRVIRSLADSLVVMRRGRIVESGPAAAIFRDPQHPYTRRLFDAVFADAT